MTENKEDFVSINTQVIEVKDLKILIKKKLGLFVKNS